jgi:hypothetical protein
MGDYDVYRGKRQFILTPLNGGKKFFYKSSNAAKADGWVKE